MWNPFKKGNKGQADKQTKCEECGKSGTTTKNSSGKKVCSDCHNKQA